MVLGPEVVAHATAHHASSPRYDIQTVLHTGSGSAHIGPPRPKPRMALFVHYCVYRPPLHQPGLRHGVPQPTSMAVWGYTFVFARSKPRKPQRTAPSARSFFWAELDGDSKTRSRLATRTARLCMVGSPGGARVNHYVLVLVLVRPRRCRLQRQ